MVKSGRDASRLLAGQKPGGAAFEVDDEVLIDRGPTAGQLGHVVMLAVLEPEPIYLISTELGHYQQIRQSLLRRP